MEEELREKLKKYFEITGLAIKKVRIASPQGTHLHKTAEDFLDMAKRYYEDAKHFMDKNDLLTAFGALNYAHGWLDAGARIGVFDVDHDSRLFTVD
ncbi:DUF357 domain-containing protein [Candidatus Woesearchaeota archaeon]|nr:MAG: DUF357 domain-containing protein [Candidatus Woesearchaeota archaeon]